MRFTRAPPKDLHAAVLLLVVRRDGDMQVHHGMDAHDDDPPQKADDAHDPACWIALEEHVGRLFRDKVACRSDGRAVSTRNVLPAYRCRMRSRTSSSVGVRHARAMWQQELTN